MSMGDFYRELAYKTFQPQLISNPEDSERVLEVCETQIKTSGYPQPLDEDDFLEYVYAAQEMTEIQLKGHVYRRERKPNGDWDFVLYTRLNHPGFKYDD